ncbi:hypothetical protein OFN94_31365, partial [Escherichia coli]|nr:hypothetical protein [Escherichia coli]
WLLKESYLIGCWLFIAYGDGSQEECPRYTQPDNAPLEGESKADFKRQNKQLQQKLAQNSERLTQALKELEEAKEAQLLAQQAASKLKLEVD